MFTITIEDDDGNEFVGHFNLTRSGDVELTQITPSGYTEEIVGRLQDAAQDRRYEWHDELVMEHRHNSRD